VQVENSQLHATTQPVAADHQMSLSYCPYTVLETNLRPIIYMIVV
jgi:hypothetical protein